MAQSPTLLNYRPTPPRAKARARLVRVGLLTFAVLSIHAAIILTLNPLWPAKEWIGGGAIGTPASPIERATANDEKVRDDYAPRAVGYLAVFLFSQWLFLLPRGS